MVLFLGNSDVWEDFYQSLIMEGGVGHEEQPNFVLHQMEE